MWKVAVGIGLAVGLGWGAGASALPANNPITAGLVAAYEFNGNADDVSDNGNNGVVNGGPMLAPDRFGNPDSAYSFDGVDDYINSSGIFSPQSQGAISFWFNSSSNSVGGLVSSRSDFGYLTGDLIVQIDIPQDGFSFYYWNGGTVNNGGFWHAPGSGGLLGPPPSESWHHAVLNWNSTAGSTVYLDGMPRGSAPVTAPIFGNLDLEIGRQGHVHSSDCCYGYFGGSIDDVYIYNRALSAGEVSTLYSVPEPTTTALFSLGLIGLARVNRRRDS